MNEARIESRYTEARERYAELGVDTERALETAASVAVSINCWQADDVAGLEGASGITGGGILATGGYPGRARTGDEIRADFDLATRLIPGPHRFNLHASYRETDGADVDRDAIEPAHFQRWIDWAADRSVPLDFNGTFFSHPKAAGGFTLAHPDPGVRAFWIEHGKRCREISEAMGKAQRSPSINNLWIPDGWKDWTADRLAPRERLVAALDELLAPEVDPTATRDAVESKLFGIGSESYVVGSHEFYLAYAISRGVLFTMDSGHFHPTESIADKISALLPFVPELLLHVSRPVRWDSDHVVLRDDATRDILREIVRADALDRVWLAVDFFDASINRISAWVVGLRATKQALLEALLEPRAQMLEAERTGRLADRLAWLEEAKLLPLADVWAMFCLRAGVPADESWMDEVARYERDVLAGRG